MNRVRLSSAHLVLLVSIGVVIFLSVLPAGALIYGSFLDKPPGRGGVFTLQNYVEVYTDPRTFNLLLTTTIYALGGTSISIGVGLLLAWLIVRTNMPLRSFFEIIPIIPMMIPGILSTVGWIFLASPRIGLFNSLLMGITGLQEPLFNIYTMAGMIFVDGLHGVPLAYMFIAAALRSMDPALEDAARVSGSGTWHTLTRVTLPIIRPASLAAFVLCFVRALESFETPTFLGIPARIFVLTTAIFRETNWYPANYGAASAYAITLLIISTAFVYLYRVMVRRSERFVTLIGKGYAPHIIELGRWRYLALTFVTVFLLLAAVLPLSMLVLTSLMPKVKPPTLETFQTLTLEHYKTVISETVTWRAMLNSTFLAVFGATVCMLLTSVIAYVTTRTKVKGRGILESLAFLPYSFPGIVLAVGLLWAYVRLPLVYGTIWILMIAYITRYMPYGLRATTSTIVQIHQELEESSRTCGASWLRTFVSVILPLLRPGFMAGWIYLAIIFLRELSASILLYTTGSEVVSVLIYMLNENGHFEALSALGVLLAAATMMLTLISMKMSKVRLA